MITLEKLRVYRKFDGDADAHARTQSFNTEASTNAEWPLIDELVQRLKIIRGGLASREFMEQTEEALLRNIDNESVREELLRLAETKV